MKKKSAEKKNQQNYPNQSQRDFSGSLLSLTQKIAEIKIKTKPFFSSKQASQSKIKSQKWVAEN